MAVKLVHLKGEMAVPADDWASVLAALPTRILNSRNESGCLVFNAVPVADSLLLQVAETFTDQTAFDVHQARVRDSSWAKITARCQRHYQVSYVDEIP